MEKDTKSKQYYNKNHPNINSYSVLVEEELERLIKIVAQLHNFFWND